MTHSDYREWCEHCVAGRGQSDPHRKVRIKEDEDEEAENVRTTVSLDYLYMSEKLEIMIEEEAKRRRV